MDYSQIPIFYWLMAGVSIVVFWVIGISAYPKLPERSAIHWPFTSSQPDGFAGRAVVAFLVPVLATLTGLMLTWPAFEKPESITTTNLVFSGLFFLLTMTMVLVSYIGLIVWNVRGPFNMPRFMKWVLGVYFAAVMLALAALIVS